MARFAVIQDGKVVNVAEAEPGFAVNQGWIEAPPTVAAGWGWDGKSWSAPQADSAAAKQAKIDQVDQRLQDVLDAGAPTSQGLHIALDDGSRADMTAMATTALAANGSVGVNWPDSYKLGWISMENTRIPLVNPADGLVLAAGVGDFYARARQHARDLKDAIAAASGTALNAIDPAAGWPS